jgi:signal transduction histidine kinase
VPTSMVLPCPPHLMAKLRLHIAEAVGGVLRHGVKNKLGNLRNAGYLIKKRMAAQLAAEPDGKTASLLDLVGDQVREADAMLEALRIVDVPGETPSIDLADQARRLIAVLVPSAGRTIEGPAAGAAGRAEIDPLELELVLFLLLENALQAGGDGPVEVTVGAAGAGRVALEVLDRGPGFSEEAARRAFEPFFSSRGPFGAGLKVAQRIAIRWGGEALVGDRPGGGARVALVLPAPEGSGA